MDARKLVEEYLPSVNIMQLATSLNNQPWVCTVHFITDNDLNFYWASTLDRRHSKEIKDNSKAALTVMVHENTPEENYVIGISVEGEVELLGGDIDDVIGQKYVDHHDKGSNLVSEIREGKNPHKFYRLKPSKIVLFDNKNFPESPRQEIVL